MDKVSAGCNHSCFLRGGKVKCFGSNDFGNLGLEQESTFEVSHHGTGPGEMGDNLPFVILREGVYATDISVGRDHTCIVADILDKKGRVMCWGYNFYGQLGYGDTTDRGGRKGDMKALDIVDLDSDVDAQVIFISAGYGHTCVIISFASKSNANIPTNNMLKCFGWNEFAQLGTGDIINRGDQPDQMGNHLRPVDLGTGRNPVAVGAGQLHTCALIESGEMKCWGMNNFGQLGLGEIAQIGGDANQMGNKLPPVNFGLGLVATAIAVGSKHSCALLNNRKLKCWGNNEGQLGLGDRLDRGNSDDTIGDELPYVDIGTNLNIDKVFTGGIHTCVKTDNGLVKCFGGNGYGQLGLASGFTASVGDKSNQMGDKLPFLDFGKVSKVESMELGCLHTCALIADETKSLKCFGNNAKGQLGQGSTTAIGIEVTSMGSNLPAVELGKFPTPPPSETKSPTVKTNPPTVYVPEEIKNAEKFVCSQFLTIESCEIEGNRIISDSDEAKKNQPLFPDSDNYMPCPKSGSVCVWDRSDDIGNCICGMNGDRIIKSEYDVSISVLQRESTIVWILTSLMALLISLLIRASNNAALAASKEMRTGRRSSITLQTPIHLSTLSRQPSSAQRASAIGITPISQLPPTNTPVSQATHSDIVRRTSSAEGRPMHSRARNLSRTDQF